MQREGEKEFVATKKKSRYKYKSMIHIKKIYERYSSRHRNTTYGSNKKKEINKGNQDLYRSLKSAFAILII